MITMAHALRVSQMSDRGVIRLIDANANRALEGVRVCEDIVRFHLGAREEFRQIRRMRHAIAHAVSHLPMSVAERLRARSSTADVGRDAPARSIASVDRLLLMNFQRAKESLRVLEECSRLIAPRHTEAFQRLRFHTYALERTVLLRRLATLRDH